MGTRRRWYATAVLTCGLVALTAPAASAAASSSAASRPGCDAVVGDSAGVLSASDLTTLEKRTSHLAATTMLRIRTEQSVPGGNLNAYEKTLQKHCGWADSANVRQPKLLVVMVSTDDRQMGIYPGPALVGRITEPVWLGIEQQQMRAYFADQDWADGLAAGTDTLSKVLAGQSLEQITKASPSATAGGAGPAASASDGGPIQYDANGNLIQGDGSSAHPFVEDPNGILPGDSGISTSSIQTGIAVTGGLIAVIALSVIGVVVTLIVRSSSRVRPSGPYGPGQFNPLMPGPPRGFPGHQGGAWDTPGFGGDPGGGGSSGGDFGGGGGSPSDGGGGSSGF